MSKSVIIQALNNDYLNEIVHPCKVAQHEIKLTETKTKGTTKTTARALNPLFSQHKLTWEPIIIYLANFVVSAMQILNILKMIQLNFPNRRQHILWR